MSGEFSNLLKQVNINSETDEPNITLVDSKDAFDDAIKDLSKYKKMAFDAEGVDLSRTGELTIATLQGFDENGLETPIYVIDVQVLGADVVFSKDRSSLRPILEDVELNKVTFDCRSDSDAFFHQYGVTLAGTFDLQIFDQAIRIHQGSIPPKRNDYVRNGGIPFLPGMRKVLERYCIKGSIHKSNAPHRRDQSVWKKRPLSSECIEYAGNDVHAITILWRKMSSTKVSDILMKRTIEHSLRYESMFRDRSEEVHFYFDKEFIMEEHGIIMENELPLQHLRKKETSASFAVQRWDKAINAMNSRLSSAFNDVIFILQHDDWYTKSGMDEIRRLAAEHPFTANQKFRIANPPELQREEDFYDDNYHEDYDSF